jgi:hypothetical protein
MIPSEFNVCIQACHACAVACDHCSTACLQEDDPRMMARCIELDMECAAICRLAAASMARGSEFAEDVCALCADICEACGSECGKHPMEHCQDCAQACMRCAQECRDMAGTA